MHYLFIGEDSAAKDRNIAELKKKYIPSQDALEFDFEILHGLKLEAELLKKSLIALPALSPQRVIVIRQVQKLNPQNKELIIEFLGSDPKHIVLILDSDEGDLKNAFVTKISKYVKVLQVQQEVKQNVFDMTRALSQRKPADALLILNSLLAGGVQPLQIMGGIVWFWGNSRPKIAPEKFSEGLQALGDADLNIKRSRVKPEQALEILVIKLGSLIAY